MNVFTGYESGHTNSYGFRNTFTGAQSGYYNTSGSYNVFSGYRSGYNNINGSDNIFSGYYSGYLNSSGSYNIFSGWQSGHSNTSGNYNTCIGYRAGYSNSTGSYNVFIGRHAGVKETGSNRLYIDNSEFTSNNIPLIYGKFDTDQLGINTTTIPSGYTMSIKGKLITEEIKVQQYGTSGWPDYVFKKEYKLPSLQEVEKQIKDNGHLKDIPSAEEVAKNGFLLGEMNAKLLQKIEELTLYSIEQEARIKRLEALFLK